MLFAIQLQVVFRSFPGLVSVLSVQNLPKGCGFFFSDFCSVSTLAKLIEAPWNIMIIEELKG
jgi:hypothetical protein